LGDLRRGLNSSNSDTAILNLSEAELIEILSNHGLQCAEVDVDGAFS